MYDFLQTPEWKAQRERVLHRDNYKCKICGAQHDVMNVHHIFYHHPLSEMNDNDLVTLCPNCHSVVHSIQKRMNEFAEVEMRKLKQEWGKKMSDEINSSFPSGIIGVNKSVAISIIRRTFYEQRDHGWAIEPDFQTLQKNVKTKSLCRR